MTSDAQNLDQTRESDSWLSAVFAAAAGPVVDMAFVDRILARMRKRQRIRGGVIPGSIICAAALALWQFSGLTATFPVFETTALAAPEWLMASAYSPFMTALFVIALTLWMIAEDA